MSERAAERIFRTASESIDVLAAPVDRVVAQARDMRRRRRRIVAGTVAVLVLIVGVVGWATTRPPAEPKLEPATVTTVPNPADVVWYAAGRLHLDHVTVQLPTLTDLVEVGDGAVYGDRDGSVVLVDGDGARTVLGQKEPDAPLVASEEKRWAAWIDVSGELIVHDLLIDEEVGAVPVRAGSRPLAINEDQVYYASGRTAFVWTVPDGRPQQLERPGLLDVASATHVYQAGRAIDMVQAFFSVHFVRPGEGAQLSPGGMFVLTRPAGELASGQPFRPLVYDARSGDLLHSGVRGDEVVYDATFGPNHDVTYLVARVVDLIDEDISGDPARLLVLRTCVLETEECHDVAPVPLAGERPMLAH